MSHVVIRAAKIADAQHVQKIYLANRKGAQADKVIEHWQKLLKRDKTHCLVAEVDYTILGYVMFRHETAHAVHISSLYVDPESQGQGVGKKLLDTIKLKASSITLEVFKDNIRALAFYEKNGFETIQTQDGQLSPLKYCMKYQKL